MQVAVAVATTLPSCMSSPITLQMSRPRLTNRARPTIGPGFAGRKNDTLRFSVAQNSSLAERRGDEECGHVVEHRGEHAALHLAGGVEELLGADVVGLERAGVEVDSRMCPPSVVAIDGGAASPRCSLAK